VERGRRERGRSRVALDMREERGRRSKYMGGRNDGSVPNKGSACKGGEKGCLLMIERRNKMGGELSQ